MINYKKSLLSVATAAAIMTSSLAADYLPLTTPTKDFQWVSIGISGLKSDGTAEVPAVAGAFRIDGVVDGEPENVITDADSADLLPVSGMQRGGKDLVKMDLLSGLTTEIRIDTTGNTYLESDPVRTMYVKISGTSTILFSVEYKATMEGQILEFVVGTGEAYETKLNYENIFANPASATVIAGTLFQAAIEGDKLESLTETDSVVDYDFTDNPPKASEWTVLNNRSAAEDGKDVSTLRMYTFNALDRKWEIFDTRNNELANDFTIIKKAKGYWARLDNEATDGVADMLDTDSEKESGLVLGDPVLTTADYTAAGLAEGWNYIAFDGQDSQIRDAVSGVIATFTADGTMALTDSSGNHTLSFAVTGTGDNVVVAKEINTAISEAVLLGTMPKTFQVKAFPAVAIGGDAVAIISNRKFTIDDTVACITTVTTLTGSGTTLLHPNDGSGLDGTPLTSCPDLGAGTTATGLDGAMSIYGEFAMIIEPLVIADTARVLGEASIQLDRSLVGGMDAKTDILNTDDTVAKVVTTLTANAAGVVPTEIDLDIAGAPKHILLAATQPFTIRDHTFTRVYEYNAQGAVDSLLSFSNGGDADVLTTDAAADVVDDINAAGSGTGATGLSAAEDADGKIIIVGNNDGESNYYVAETLADLVQISTSAHDESRGAVKAVISLDQLVKIDNRNIHQIDINEMTDEALDSYHLDFITEFGTTVTGTTITPFIVGWTDGVDSDTSGQEDHIDFLDALVLQLNTDLLAAGMKSTASHNGAIGTDIDAALITVTGSDVVSVTLTQLAGAVSTELVTVIGADNGYIATDYSGDLAIDLKFNNVATPNYTMDGPLYTMKDSNMSLRALVSGTTDIEGGLGEVTWESIDLTRNPSEWFDSQDYDLFETTANVGYWAYLTPSLETNLSIVASSFPGTYKHHFDLDDGTGIGTTTNFVSGTLTLNVDGISTAEQLLSARVTATFGGETIELTQAAAGGVFTGLIDTHEARSVSTNEEIDVIVNIADGLGNNAIYTITDLFDNVKPQKPVITIDNGQITVDANATDTDVAQFYVFSGIPLESDVAQDIVDDADGTIAGTGGVVTVACDGQVAATWDGTADGITVVAVDGNGTFGSGNASDSSTVKMMRILLDRSLITATNASGIWESTSDAYDYNSSCATSGIVSLDHTAVTVSSLTDDETVKFAFATDGNVSGLDVPITVYVENDDEGTYARVVAAVTYPSSYAGTDAFIQLGDFVYGFELPTASDLDDGTVAGIAENDPLELDEIPASANPKDAEVQL